MEVFCYECPEAPEPLRFCAKVYDVVRGKMELLPIVFYRTTREEAVAAAQLDYDTKLSAEAKRREPRPKKAASNEPQYAEEAI